MSEPVTGTQRTQQPRRVLKLSSRTDCPVQLTFESTLQAAKVFGQSIRKLRRSLLSCANCTGVDDCPIRQKVGEAIDMAIIEITDEWGLAEHD